MATINRKTVEHLAHLSRLSLTEEEVGMFARDMERIVKLVTSLKKVDTAGVTPMHSGTGTKNIFRIDEADLSERATFADGVGRITRSFPESHEGHLKVPKIL